MERTQPDVVAVSRRILWSVVSAPFRLGYRVLMALAEWCDRFSNGGK